MNDGYTTHAFWEIAHNNHTPKCFTQYFEKYLPDNYELIAGTKIDNIHMYYKLIKVNVVCTMHDIKFILEIPLKTAGQYFTLFKTIALPTPVFNDTFAIYKLDFISGWHIERLHFINSQGRTEM
jgi:hypothetical protein